jgi:hypothetical protein
MVCLYKTPFSDFPMVSPWVFPVLLTIENSYVAFRCFPVLVRLTTLVFFNEPVIEEHIENLPGGRHGYLHRLGDFLRRTPFLGRLQRVERSSPHLRIPTPFFRDAHILKGRVQSRVGPGQLLDFTT